MLTRRTIIKHSMMLASGMVLGLNGHAQSQVKCQGCILGEHTIEGAAVNQIGSTVYRQGNEPMISHSGDPDFDLALAETLAKISDCFDVLPGFAFYEDFTGHNAYASRADRLGHQQGTVLFGQGMLTQLMSSADHPALSVATVCAHEFGHIVQFRYGMDQTLLDGQTTHKRAELQADFFAGYFAGRRKLERADFNAAIFAETQYEWGDSRYNDVDHHGTPKERADAVVRGFHTAYTDRRSLHDMLPISVNYAMSL